MCGIFGFTFNCRTPEVFLRKMGQAMIHRGPDGEGYYWDENVSMGMRRLSIIDIEKGNQPFFNHDKSIIVFCNGEIYNFKELREILRRKGYLFYTNSDIEVIPHLYQEYGIQFVSKLNGMFAIALYDKNIQKVFLIRDRLGIKPLYYTISNGSLIFSSEIKPILAQERISKQIDCQALSTYLDLMYIPAPMSPFSEIRKLESGTYLSWTRNGHSLERYWDLAPTNVNGSEDKFFEGLLELLEDSIHLELISDVPVGSFLSGGIDSSFVTAVAAKLSHKQFSAFHMRWKGIHGKIDESKYAHQVADKYGASKIFKDVNKIDVVGLLPKLVYHLEEPFADAAFIPTFFLADIAKKTVKVILSGAGGDELFGGYPRYRKYSFLKSVIGKVLYNRGKAFSYFDVCKTGFQKKWSKLFPWYKPDFFRASFEKEYVENRTYDPFNAMMKSDISYYLQDDILFLNDKVTMAASLECRVPLLDHRIVELACAIPSSLKIRNGHRKHLFNRVAERYLPREAIYRQKEGFGFPIEKPINEFKELYFDILLEQGFLAKNGLIDQNRLRRLLLKISYTREESWLYWQILILEIWFQLFMENRPYEDIYGF